LRAAASKSHCSPGGADKPYAFGLATALMLKGIGFDLIAGDELDSP